MKMQLVLWKYSTKDGHKWIDVKNVKKKKKIIIIIIYKYIYIFLDVDAPLMSKISYW